MALPESSCLLPQSPGEDDDDDDDNVGDDVDDGYNDDEDDDDDDDDNNDVDKHASNFPDKTTLMSILSGAQGGDWRERFD